MLLTDAELQSLAPQALDLRESEEAHMEDPTKKVFAVHPAANLFPMMPAEELKSLTEDIQKNGLVEPILLYEGQVLDGRNRLAACELARVEPLYKDAALNGASPTLFVVSKNLHRRHLTTSQRGAIAVTLIPMLKEEAKKRMSEGGKKHGASHSAREFLTSLQEGVQPATPLDDHAPNGHLGTSYEIAAKALQVSRTTVQQAIKVKDADPEAFDRVLRGEIPVKRVYRKIMAAEATRIPAAPGKRRSPTGKRQQQYAKRKMIEVLSNIRGLCRGVTELNIPLIAIALSPEERRTWIAIGGETANQLRDFARKLKAEQ